MTENMQMQVLKQFLQFQPPRLQDDVSVNTDESITHKYDATTMVRAGTSAL